MPADNVDLVFLIDASDSMRPCFDGLREHLQALVQPLQQTSFNLRLGMLAYNCERQSGGYVYQLRFIDPGVTGLEIYSEAPQSIAPRVFTSDVRQFVAALGQVEVGGDEDTLMALDTALDLPFGDIRDTRRVIALFTDEKVETGVRGAAGAKENLDAIVDKIMARKVMLFGYMPECAAADRLSEAEKSEIDCLDLKKGFANVDFDKLLRGLGKSISVSQAPLKGSGETWKRALFGQDGFSRTSAGPFGADS